MWIETVWVYEGVIADILPDKRVIAKAKGFNRITLSTKKVHNTH